MEAFMGILTLGLWIPLLVFLAYCMVNPEGGKIA